MSTAAFARYARAYDLLYRDKDYPGEARFVDGLLRGAGARPPGPLLDIGCGTGVHARAMTALGWQVTGVDLSPDMIALARERTPAALGIRYVVGAARALDLPERFPAIVSLFHVASYQAEQGELGQMCATVARHLLPGGVFIFDFWHGPGVRAEPPEVRRREVSDATLRVERLCTPAHREAENRIEVRYDMRVEETGSGAVEEFSETHRLRYFFFPEVAAALEAAGLAVEETRSGLTEAPLTDRSWYGLVVARKG